jgi:hypothetical protein
MQAVRQRRYWTLICNRSKQRRRRNKQANRDRSRANRSALPTGDGPEAVRLKPLAAEYYQLTGKPLGERSAEGK